MSEKTIGPITLILAAALVFGGCVLGAFMIVSGLGERRTEVTVSPTVLGPGEKATGFEDMVSIGGGMFVAVRGESEFFLVEADSEKKLQIVDVFRLSKDPNRYIREPNRRRYHGYYLDSLSEEFWEDLRAKREVFVNAVETEASEEETAEAAMKLAEAGDFEFLKPYVMVDNKTDVRVWRAVAPALGKYGIPEAAEALTKMYRMESRERQDDIFELMKKALGESFLEDVEKLGREEAVKKLEKAYLNKQGGD